MCCYFSNRPNITRRQRGTSQKKMKRKKEEKRNKLPNAMWELSRNRSRYKPMDTKQEHELRLFTLIHPHYFITYCHHIRVSFFRMLFMEYLAHLVSINAEILTTQDIMIRLRFGRHQSWESTYWRWVTIAGGITTQKEKPEEIQCVAEFFIRSACGRRRRHRRHFRWPSTFMNNNGP